MNRVCAPIFLVLLLSLAACSSRSVTLVNPRSGARIECGGTGYGIMAPAAEGIVEECIRDYERQGYVPVERLSPAERADLERRGALPRPEPPARTGY
jgi:hypothetical protein